MGRRGLRVETREAVAQDAPFITADPGHAPADTPRGVEALTRRSRDGTWTKKLNRSYFGFKLSVKTDLRYGLIRAFRATTASVHDSQVDLSRRGEAVYRDKGYFGVGASEGIRRHDAAWDEGRADRYLGRLRNTRISRKRAPIERTFSVLKRVFRAGHVLVTTVPRAKAKNMLSSCLCFNLMQMLTISKRVQV